MSNNEFYCHHCLNFKKLSLRVDEESTHFHAICRTCSEARKNKKNTEDPKYKRYKNKAYKSGKKNYTVPRRTNDMLHEFGVDNETVRVNKNQD